MNTVIATSRRSAGHMSAWLSWVPMKVKLALALSVGFIFNPYANTNLGQIVATLAVGGVAVGMSFEFWGASQVLPKILAFSKNAESGLIANDIKMLVLLALGVMVILFGNTPDSRLWFVVLAWLACLPYRSVGPPLVSFFNDTEPKGKDAK